MQCDGFGVYALQVLEVCSASYQFPSHKFHHNDILCICLIYYFEVVGIYLLFHLIICALPHICIHIQNTHTCMYTHTNVSMHLHFEDSIPFYPPFSCGYDRIFSGSCFGEKSRIEVLKSVRSELDFKMSLPYGDVKRLTFRFLQPLSDGCALWGWREGGKRERGRISPELMKSMKPIYEVYTSAKYPKIYISRYTSDNYFEIVYIFFCS